MTDTPQAKFTSKLIQYKDLDTCIFEVLNHLEEEIHFHLDKSDDRSSVSLTLNSKDQRLEAIPEKTLIRIYSKELDDCIQIHDIRRVEDRLDIYLSIDIEKFYRYITYKKKDRDASFKLIIDEDKNDEVCLIGWPFGTKNKYPIFKTNSAKALKDIFCGLINHTDYLVQNAPYSYSPYQFSAFKFDEFMDKSRGKWHDLSEEKQQKVRDLYLPKEINEQSNLLFKKIYKYFIQRSERGDQILFKLCMSNKEFEDFHNETVETYEKKELVKAMSEAATLWHK